MIALPMTPLPMNSLPMTTASTFVLPAGNWSTVLDCLCESFPAIERERWRDRFARALILDANKNPLDISHPHRAGMRVYYFREVPNEKEIPFSERVLYADDNLIVVDKPHFLPVIPSGEYVAQTLLARLIKRFENIEIAPLHRIDRHTAGLVMFSARQSTRAAYQALFRERAIEKKYEAIARAMSDRQFPLIRQSRIVRGDPFFLSREIDGVPNSETHIEVIESAERIGQNQSGEWWRYRLAPITGKKHQLRLHMAALGAPIQNDPFYPIVRSDVFDDYSKPLKLLARELRFIDPLDNRERFFESQLSL